MARKKIWLTWLPTEGGDGAEGGSGPQDTVAFLTHSGLEVGGAPWVDDPDNLAWAELGNLLLGENAPDIWLVAGTGPDFAAPATRYALSMIAAMLREAERPIAMACLGLDGALDPEAMPSLLSSALLLDGNDFGWAAQVLNARPAEEEDFRLGVIAQKLLGQWLELGPREGEWHGAMVGAAEGGSITHHAVGTKGQLPQRATLEYPLQGLEAELAGTKFTAWAVQNRLGPEDSYFVRIEGRPARLILGQHPESDEAEVRVLDLI